MNNTQNKGAPYEVLFLSGKLVGNQHNRYEGILQYAIMILYQIGLESGSTENTLKKFILPLHMAI